MVGAFHKRRPICDGAGLCSIGRWAPWARPETRHPRLRGMRELIASGVHKWCGEMSLTVGELFDRLAMGNVLEEPISDCLLEEITEEALSLYDGVDGGARPRDDDRRQLVRVRLLQSLMKDAGDPDARGMDHYHKGVRLRGNCQ